MTRAAALVVAALAAAACDAAPVVGSGRVTTTAVQVPGPFRGVRAEGAFDVEVVAAAAPSIEVVGDDNLAAVLRAEAVEGTLRLSTSGAWSSANRLVVRVGVTDPAWVTAVGGVTLRSAALRGDVVAVHAEGTSRVTVESVTGREVRLTARGAAVLTTTGSGVARLVLRATEKATIDAAVACDDATVTAESASVVRGVSARTAQIRTTGAARMELDVSERLTADVMGRSVVRYGGRPKVGGELGELATFAPK